MIGVLQGDKAVNSIPLLQSTAIVVEVRDTNDLPMEGATVVFTLPGPGAGSTFIGGATSFTTRTDFHGQASALEIVPKVAGQFRIKVAATLGTRKGETAVTQTNTNRTLSAHGERGGPAWYMRKRTWIIAGVAAAAGVTRRTPDRPAENSHSHSRGAGISMSSPKFSAGRRLLPVLTVLLYTLQAATAQTVTWSAPSNGFIFDAVSSSIRPISGFVGSATVGAPVITSVAWAAIAPNAQSAIVEQNSKLLWIADLHAPGATQDLGWITPARQALWASDSNRVAVLTDAGVRWLTIAGRSLSVEHSWPMVNALREWTLLATDASANAIVMVRRTGRESVAWFASENGSPTVLPVDGRSVAAAAFNSTGSAVYIVNSTLHQILRVDSPAAAAVTTVVLTSAQYVSGAIGLILSPDDSRIFVIDGSELAIPAVDAATGNLAGTIALDAPVRLVSLFSPGSYLLDPGSKATPFLFLQTAVAGAVTFVPRAE